MAKRGLCILLAVLTLFALAVPAFAEEAPAEEPIATEEPVVEATEEPIATEVPVVTEEPIVTEVPVEVTEEPVVTEVPAEATEVPVITEVPVVTEEPIVTEVPVEVTEEPVATEAPVVMEEPVVTEEPVEVPEATEAPEEIEEPEAASVFAGAVGVCGAEGDGGNLTWALSSDGVLTISGKGRMRNYDWRDNTDAPWVEYSDSIKSVVIEEGVASIGNSAFSNYASLSSVSFPNSLSDIGHSAFEYTGLTSANFPAGLDYVDQYAFCGCTSLASVTFPADSGIIRLVINQGAFSGCTSLVNVSFSKRVGSISADAFDETPWEKAQGDFVIIDNVLISYQGTASSVTIPSGVTSIEDNAFEKCTSLTSVIIPSSVTSIGNYAFSGCVNLASVTVPSSVTDIGRYAFAEVPWMAAQTSDFIMAGDVLIGYKGTNSDVTIPDNVKSIGGGAFYGCTGLTKVMLPTTVTRICSAAFDGCKQLEVVILNPSCYICTNGYRTWLGAKSYQYTTYYTFPNGTIIWGYDGSTAEWFAGASFQSIGPAPVTSTPVPTAAPEPTPAPKPATLAAPKLSKVSNETTGVKISWGAVSGAAKYRVFYKGGSVKKWTKLADTTSTSYTWKKAKSGTKYSFTVRCISKDGKSYTSAYDTKGKTVTYVAAPKLSKVSNEATGVKITWGKVTGAAKYRVFYKGGNVKSWKKLADTTSTSYTWKKAKSGTKYTFTVRCISKDGKSYTSAYDTKGKTVTYVAAPTVKIAKTSGGIKVTWSKVKGASKYMVYYKEGNGGWKKIGATGKTSYTWKKAVNGKTYAFTVRCTDAKKNLLSAYKASNSLKYKK